MTGCALALSPRLVSASGRRQRRSKVSRRAPAGLRKVVRMAASRPASSSSDSGSGAGGEAPGGPRFPALEHMDTLRAHGDLGPEYHDLNMAEMELGAYCSALGPDAETEKCWQAYSYLEQRHEVSMASCDEEDLEQLNSIAHQLLSQGSMDDLVATFSSLARVDSLRAARAGQAAAEPAPASQQPAKAAPDPLHALFVRMDANGDGLLSMAEFRQSMALLGDELDGGTVALIGDAMDVHGFITEQQFRDIVEAEALNSKSEVAQLWRHHIRPQHH